MLRIQTPGRWESPRRPDSRRRSRSATRRQGRSRWGCRRPSCPPPRCHPSRYPTGCRRSWPAAPAGCPRRAAGHPVVAHHAVDAPVDLDAGRIGVVVHEIAVGGGGAADPDARTAAVCSDEDAARSVAVHDVADDLDLRQRVSAEHDPRVGAAGVGREARDAQSPDQAAAGPIAQLEARLGARTGLRPVDGDAGYAVVAVQRDDRVGTGAGLRVAIDLQRSGDGGQHGQRQDRRGPTPGDREHDAIAPPDPPATHSPAAAPLAWLPLLAMIASRRVQTPSFATLSAALLTVIVAACAAPAASRTTRARMFFARVLRAAGMVDSGRCLGLGNASPRPIRTSATCVSARIDCPAGRAAWRERVAAPSRTGRRRACTAPVAPASAQPRAVTKANREAAHACRARRRVASTLSGFDRSRVSPDAPTAPLAGFEPGRRPLRPRHRHGGLQRPSRAPPSMPRTHP